MHSVKVAAWCIGLWVPLRLLIEWMFPFIPFSTPNWFGRILAEMPFYYVITWVSELITGRGHMPGHWGMALLASVLEGIAISMLILVAAYVRSRIRTLGR